MYNVRRCVLAGTRIHLKSFLPKKTILDQNISSNQSFRHDIVVRGIGSSHKITFNPQNTIPPEAPEVPPLQVSEIDLTTFLEPVTLPSTATGSTVSETLSEVVTMGVSSTDLGLTWWLPTGGLYNLLDLLHNYFPWWGSIAIATLAARILLTPVVIYNQKNTAKMSHVMPQQQLARKKLQKAMRIGSQLDIMKAFQEMEEVSKKTQYSMKKMFLGPMAQAPVFMSFFITLRAMANYPIFSMQTGGLFWFTDLTICDPYYIMPVLTAASLFAVMKLGVEFGNQSNPNADPRIQKGVMYGFPLLSLIFTSNFASALLCYWLTSNLISICQVAILNQPKIRSKLGIPELIKWSKEDLPEKEEKGFIQGFREEMKLIKTASDMVANARLVSKQKFERAGTGPIKQTFKKNPIVERRGDD